MTLKLNAWPGYMSHVLYVLCQETTHRIQLPATSDYGSD